MDEDVVITIDDVRRAGFCPRGIRTWFEGHGLDFRDFLKNGITVGELNKIDDGMIPIVINAKRERESHGQK